MQNIANEILKILEKNNLTVRQAINILGYAIDLLETNSVIKIKNDK